ncbi:hypothetical protein EON63_22820 [archaeon]|nr:MAG: hypothetical protein EON63_22820 [archaeon]
MVVHVHAQVMVQGMLRSVCACDVMVRGDRYPRRVRVYGGQSGAYTITHKPEGVFQLTPSAYNKVLVCVQPKRLGTYTSLVMVVDIDTREVVGSYLLTITCTTPSVTRVYEVRSPPDRGLYKKILFKNPWDMQRKFVLVSSDDEVMRPRYIVWMA